ncbi:MAG: SDR family oxidoreductase [Pseudomonadota bacterium]
MILKDKVVLITGIGPGMGSHLANLAAQEGARGIVLASRNQANLTRSKNEIEALDLEAQVLECVLDISDQAACDEVIQQAVSTFGQLDALINNAFAFSPFKPIEDSDIDEWKSVLDVNLFGTLYLSQAAANQMKQQDTGGAIVMVNTMSARNPNVGEAGYAVSKGALKTATNYLAREVGKYGIRVNTLAPGWMWGASVKAHFEYAASQGAGNVETLKQHVEKDIALPSMPTDEECAKAVLFLASDYAKAITGATLDANGGHYIPL